MEIRKITINNGIKEINNVVDLRCYFEDKQAENSTTWELVKYKVRKQGFKNIVSIVAEVVGGF